jgi:transposase
MPATTARKFYASDLTNEQWQTIEPLLPGQKQGGRERQVDLREITSAISYRDLPAATD